MATMGIQPVTTLINFKNGDTKVVVWNISATAIVRSFSVTPLMIDVDSGAIGIAEITRVQYIVKKTAPVRQVWITVKNTGGMMIHCEIWVSWIKQ